MKDMMQSLQFKPAGIKECVQNESKYHKLKIIGFAFLMAGIGTTYQAYFNDLVYRSGIYQKRALAGQETFTEFRDGDNPNTLWQVKNELDVLEGRDFKQLKYMQTGGFNLNFAEQSWEWRGSKDFTDLNGQTFGAQRPNINNDEDGLALGRTGRQSQGAGENWFDTTWKHAYARVDRNSVTGNQELPAATTQTDTTNFGGLTWETLDAYSNANGNIYNGQLYWTQQQRFDHAYFISQAANAAGAGLLQWRRDRYEDWEKMHSKIQWFDTAACLDGGHIGNVNAVTINPATTRYSRRPANVDDPCDSLQSVDGSTTCWTYTAAETASWWRGTAWDEANPAKQEAANINNPDIPDRVDKGGELDIPYVDTYRQDSQTVQNPTLLGNVDWKQSWETSITVTGSMNWADEDLYKDLLKDYIDLFEDCDVDCQANGSQLTTIAGLMGAVYGLVTLNAVFMFVGTWRWWARVCSIWCTFGVCLFQFCSLIAAGVMMFTKYNAICARSMTETMGVGNIWTMADDFYMTFSLWIISFITMFCFVCCGLCSAIREK